MHFHPGSIWYFSHVHTHDAQLSFLVMTTPPGYCIPLSQQLNVVGDVVVGALVVRTIVVGAFVVVSIKYIHNFDKFDPYFCLIVNKHQRRERV